MEPINIYRYSTLKKKEVSLFALHHLMVNSDIQ